MIAQLSKEYIFTKPSKVLPRLLSYLFYEGRPATTRGRWFNPITFYSLRKAVRKPVNPLSESPVFITGTGRSGSTVLGMILSLHGESVFLNEPKALWFVANPEDDLIGSYSSGNAGYILNASQASPEIGNKVKALYSSLLNKTNNHIIIDKYPEMIFRIGFLNALFKNPKYIFLIRNPWDTIASAASWSEQHVNGSGTEDWWGVHNRKWKLLVDQVVSRDPLLAEESDLVATITSQHEKAAVEWIVTMNYGLKMMESFPERMLQVKYENLCDHPEKIIREIFAFTGMKCDNTCLEYGKKILRATPVKPRPKMPPVLMNAILILCEKLEYQGHSSSINVTE